MKDSQSSVTAAGVAFLRAAHQSTPAGRRVLDDPFAVPMLPRAAGRCLARWRAFCRWIDRKQPHLIESIATRDRFAEEAVCEAYAEGVRQFVMLGTGFDTLSFRVQRSCPELRVFEVDHPATSAERASRVRRAGLEGQSRAISVLADFEVDDFRDRLLDVGLSRTEPCIVNWMGVNYYLTAEAIHATLQRVADFSAPGSWLTFDFWTQVAAPADAASPAGPNFFQKVNEEVKFGIQPQEVAGLLAPYGFDVVDLTMLATRRQRYGGAQSAPDNSWYLVAARRA